MRLAALIFAIALGLTAELIDEIAVTVDNQVITGSDIISEIRVTSFLNGVKADFGQENRRRTADRMVEQLLVRREMELTRYAQPDPAEIQSALADVKRRFGSDAEYRKQLAAYRITEGDVRNALMRQLMLVRFIDLRFRPEVQIQESDVMQYCESVYLPELRKKGVTPEPSFEDVRPQCEDALAAQLVDKRVDTWLQETRGRSRITYQEDAFQ